MEYAQKGDPYCCMCNVTTRCLEDKLDFSEGEIVHTFQSRFGNDPWLQPYTDYTINDLAKQGIKDIACLLYTSPSPRDKRQSRMPSSA